MWNEESWLNAKALAMLEPEPLASLLIQATSINPSIRRRLEFELAARKNADIPAAINEWIIELGAETSFLDAKQIGELAEELDAMRTAIATHVAQASPALASELMWRFFTLAGTIFERTTEEGWEVSNVFDQACSDLVNISINTAVEAAQFAVRVSTVVNSNHYGEYRALMSAIASARPNRPAYISELQGLLQSVDNAF